MKKRAWLLFAIAAVLMSTTGAQEHGYEDETYVVVEIGPSEVRYAIEVNGGGC